jgi:hypothetical protein
MWSAARGQAVSDEQVRLLGKPQKQVEHIDILFRAEVGGLEATFIIEDKTDTTHHDDQLRRYKEIVGRHGGDVVCIYLKTGYHFGEDQRATEHGWTVIGLAEWVAFLDRHPVKHDVLDDYRSYVTDLLRKRETELAALLGPGGHEKLDVNYVQFEFIGRLASRCVETIGGPEVHRGTNMGGTPWTHFRFVRFDRALPGGSGEVLFHRVDARSAEKGQRRYYLSTRQYAGVKGNAEARTEKLRRLQLYRHAFRDAVAESECGLLFSDPAGDYQGANESEVGILFFDDATNTVRAVLDRFAIVHRGFVARIAADEVTFKMRGE